jgi:hypothetical protein
MARAKNLRHDAGGTKEIEVSTMNPIPAQSMQRIGRFVFCSASERG